MTSGLGNIGVCLSCKASCVIHVRDCCLRCYKRHLRDIKAGKQTWESLEESGTVARRKPRNAGVYANAFWAYRAAQKARSDE